MCPRKSPKLPNLRILLGSSRLRTPHVPPFSFWIGYWIGLDLPICQKKTSSSTGSDRLATSHHATMISRTLPTLLVAFIGAAKCSAFAPPTQRSSSIIRSLCTKKHHHVLSAENKSGGSSDLDDSFLSSLPSPEAVKDNIMEVRTDREVKKSIS